MRLPRERFDYSAMVDRAPLELPDGARIAVWTIVNVEEWVIERKMPRTVLPPPYGQPCIPMCPTGRGTSTACASGSGVSSRCSRPRLRATLAIKASV